MKKNIKVILIILLIPLLIFTTGCNKDNQKNKNHQVVEYKTDKGIIQLTYKDNGDYSLINSKTYVSIKNNKKNIRIDIDLSKNTIKQQENAKKTLDIAYDNYQIIDNIKFNNYKGYATISNKNIIAHVYLYLDEKEDVVSNIIISPIKKSITEKEIESGKKIEDILYNNEEVQEILNTIKYIK